MSMILQRNSFKNILRLDLLQDSKPVTFVSRALKLTESNYVQIEK